MKILGNAGHPMKEAKCFDPWWMYLYHVWYIELVFNSIELLEEIWFLLTTYALEMFFDIFIFANNAFFRTNCVPQTVDGTCKKQEPFESCIACSSNGRWEHTRSMDHSSHALHLQHQSTSISWRQPVRDSSSNLILLNHYPSLAALFRLHVWYIFNAVSTWNYLTLFEPWMNYCWKRARGGNQR